MESTQSSTPLAAAEPNPFRMTIASRFEAYCPSCGYSLQGLTAMLVVPNPPRYIGESSIAVVCRICYAADREATLDAAATVLDARILDICDCAYGVAFYSPRADQEKGHAVREVMTAREHGTPLPLIPYIDPPPPITPREPTLFDQRPRPPQLPHG